MDPKCNESENSLQDLQNLDQNSVAKEKSEEMSSGESSERVQNKQLQESGHYWWCPYFAHHYYCPFPNMGFDGNNYWPQMHSNQYSAQLVSNKPNSGLSLVQKRYKTQIKVEKKSPKSWLNGNNEYQIERLYSCRLCSDFGETKDEMSIRVHIEAHLGKVRPFVCHICGKEFKFRSNCRNHVIAHSVVRKHIHRIPKPLKDEGIN